MQQTVFPLTKKTYNKVDFIVSEANKTAFEMTEQWQNLWGVEPYPRSLIVQGPKSSGKTFLAHIWQNNAHADFILKDQSIAASKLDEFNAFIIEDADLWQKEEALLHNFNIINEQSKHLLITCTEPISANLPDLNSRIRSLNKISIGQPDDHLIKILIFKFFSDNSIKIADNVINYLIQRIPRRFDLMLDYLERVNQYSLETQHKITIPLIKKSL